MPCNLTQALRDENCRGSLGGLKAAYVTEVGNVTFFSSSLGSPIFSMSMSSSTKWYKYSFKKNSGTFNEALTTSENGGFYYVPTVTMQFTRLENNKRNELKLLAQNEVAVIVLDSNGNLIVTGQSNGLTVSEGTAGTGQVYGDLNGYSLTLSGQEPDAMLFLSSSAVLTGSIVIS
jgi:hypothetical protein